MLFLYLQLNTLELPIEYYGAGCVAVLKLEKALKQKIPKTRGQGFGRGIVVSEKSSLLVFPSGVSEMARGTRATPIRGLYQKIPKLGDRDSNPDS